MTDQLDTDAIRAKMAALKGFTEGPWEAFIDDSGGQWSSWPLSINASEQVDKTIVRPGGHWPYEWDAETSQNEACRNAYLIAAAPDMRDTILAICDEMDRLRADNERLRGDRDEGAKDYCNLSDQRDALWVESEMLRAENERLREAAEHFATWDQCWPGNINLKGACEKIRAALGQEGDA